MTISLLVGVLVISAVFFAIRAITHYPSNITGVIVAVLILIVIMPVAIIFWPGADVFAIHLAIYMITIYGLTIVFSYREHNSSVHWAPVTIIAFFVVLVLVDTFFVTLADKGLSTGLANFILPKSDVNNTATYNYPGKVVHDYYQKENLYNEYLNNIETRKLYDWDIQKGWLDLPVVAKPAIFQLKIKTKKNISITTAIVSGTFIRYSNSKMDLNFVMQHKSKGVYQVKITLPAPGRWGLVLKIQQGSKYFEVQGNTKVLPDSSVKDLSL